MSTSYCTPTSRFLQQLADKFDLQAQRRFAKAEVLSSLGLAEASVRENAKAIELETQAECLRLQARRVAEMEQDAREMRAEGYGRSEIVCYLSRTYGSAVA